MASQKVKNGNLITVSLEGVKADEIIVQNDFKGVALINTDMFGDVIVSTEGVFDLEVHAHNGTEDTAVEFGHKVFVDPSTKTLSRNESKTYFGISLGTIEAGETKKVPVKFSLG